jgi:hypothetical protein
MGKKQFNASGISFRVSENPRLAMARPSGPCEVALDPTNKYAKHPYGAFGLVWNGMNIGFVPDANRDIQDDIVAIMESGAKPDIQIIEYSYAFGEGKKKVFNDLHEGVLGSIKLVLTIPDAVSEKQNKAKEEPPKGEFRLLRSFNEPDVEVRFWPESHQYWIRDVRLVSATGLVDRCYEPFDSKTIAGRCEKPYGMKASDIIAMWGLNGESTAAFGTAVHLAMENYSRFGDRALPKMPVLRDIVTSFPWKWFEGVAIKEEVFITSAKRGLCGLCDRLVIRGDEHTVTDLKVNVDADVVDERKHKNKLIEEVPSSKVGHYVVQESVYAAMLEESGLKVNDKVCSHVWCSEWKHFSLPRVKDVLDRLCG